MVFRFSHTEWAILILICGVVLTGEAFNTAIELIVDFISPEYHEKAGKIKDLAAGAVLISAIAALGIALFLFLPKLIAYV